MSRARTVGGAPTARRRVQAVAASVLISALVAVGLGGCSFLRTDPPTDLVAQADSAAAAVRSLDGVAAAEAQVTARDPKDHPGEWVVSVRTTAADASGLESLPGPIVTTVRGAGFAGVSLLTMTLEVPAAPGVAPVVLSTLGDQGLPDTLDDDIRASDSLRRLDTVGWVGVTALRPAVTLTEEAARSATPLATAEAEVRAVPGFGSGALDSVEVTWQRGAEGVRSGSIEATASGPADELVAHLDALARTGETTWFSQTENRDAGRPVLSMESPHPERVAAELAGVTDAAADRDERPRTAFSVRDADAERWVEGFVGLPLGSPKPELDWPALDAATAAAAAPPPATAPPGGGSLPPEEPPGPEAAEQLAADTTAITEFLADAVAAAAAANAAGSAGAAGNQAVPAVQVTACDTGDGWSVHGRVLLEVWAPADAPPDAADAAFAAITAGWTAAGLQRVDRAMGTDYWSAPPPVATGVQMASIRGTADGVRVGATSPCVR